MGYRYSTMKNTPTVKPSKQDLKAQLLWAESELKQTLEKAQSLRDYIMAVRKLCGKKGPAFEQQELPGVAVIPHRRRTKGAALANQVADILRVAGAPLHVKAIVAKLADSGHPVIAKNPTNTVGVALILRADQFVKVSPNTFDLVKKQETAAETA